MGRVRAILSLALLFGVTACSRKPSYEVVGQIVAIDPARQEITVKHGDIKGFMPGMTMAFKVKDPGVMTGKEPGDLVRATLVVEDTFGYLTRVDVTGHAPLTEPPPSRSAIDVLPPGQQAPDVRLVDQDGTERHLSEWRGRVLAVTFIYTRCPLPDFCPLMDRQFLAAQREASVGPAIAGPIAPALDHSGPVVRHPPVLPGARAAARRRPEEHGLLPPGPLRIWIGSGRGSASR
jgi:protein SCO1/2